jgi:hypothetical protein
MNNVLSNEGFQVPQDKAYSTQKVEEGQGAAFKRMLFDRVIEKMMSDQESNLDDCCDKMANI